MTSRFSKCKSCASSNVIEFKTHACLYFLGCDGLMKAAVSVFPKVVVYSDCGFIQSNLSATDLRWLEKVPQGLTKHPLSWPHPGSSL